MTGPAIHVLTGCTASGKTEAALAWARARGAEIVSCDSQLFYRGMDIGTAKPSPGERARVPHHLIDLLPPSQPMDVARYAKLARAAVESIVARGAPVLVVGGSGFYLKSFFAPATDELDVPPEIRSRVAALLDSRGLPALLEPLRALNPDGLGALDTANPRRVARALERCLASGKTLAQLANEFAARPPPYAGWEIRLTRLERGRDELDRRIALRTAAMIAAGLVEEVRGLLAQGLLDNPSAARAIGYRESIAVLEGRLPAARLAEEICRSTRALVRKQRTWFRTQLPPHRIATAGDPDLPQALFAAESPGFNPD